MRRFMASILSVLWTLPRLLIKKAVHGKRFRAGRVVRISPDVVLEFERDSLVTLGSRIRIHSGSKLKVREGAELHIGSGVSINYNCIMICRSGISIGDGTEFGPSVYIYDHDHDYRKGLKEQVFVTSPVTIGKNCWIGAQSVILRGAVIGDNCVIGAGSVVRGTVPDNSVVYQKRDTVIVRQQEGQT